MCPFLPWRFHGFAPATPSGITSRNRSRCRTGAQQLGVGRDRASKRPDTHLAKHAGGLAKTAVLQSSPSPGPTRSDAEPCPNGRWCVGRTPAPDPLHAGSRAVLRQVRRAGRGTAMGPGRARHASWTAGARPNRAGRRAAYGRGCPNAEFVREGTPGATSPRERAARNRATRERHPADRLRPQRENTGRRGAVIRPPGLDATRPSRGRQRGRQGRPPRRSNAELDVVDYFSVTRDVQLLI